MYEFAVSKQFQGAWEDVKTEDFHCNGCRSNKTQC
ncbi:unnamed protein product, partial [marine sediment metagenome]